MQGRMQRSVRFWASVSAMRRAQADNGREPVVEAVAALEAAIRTAAAEGIDELTINMANRRLREAEGRVKKEELDGAKGRLRETVQAIEAHTSGVGKDYGASLLLHVYTIHPPKRPTVLVDDLRLLLFPAKKQEGEAEGDGEAARKSTLKKMMLKAQRDYHPDRNQATTRETLGRSQEEWEVLCIAICQQLARAYDGLYKGTRGSDED